MYHEEVKVYDDQGSARGTGGGGPVASCLNESESRHCCVNRTLHQPPAGESIDGLIMEMNMGWSRLRSTSYRLIMHADAAACYGV